MLISLLNSSFNKKKLDFHESYEGFAMKFVKLNLWINSTRYSKLLQRSTWYNSNEIIMFRNQENNTKKNGFETKKENLFAKIYRTLL